MAFHQFHNLNTFSLTKRSLQCLINYQIFCQCLNPCLAKNRMLSEENLSSALWSPMKMIAVLNLICLIFALIAQVVERPLSEQEFVGSNHTAAPYQRWKNGTSSSLADARIKRDCARKIE